MNNDIVINELSRPITYGQRDHVSKVNPRCFTSHLAKQSEHGFCIQLTDERFKIRKYDNEFNRFRVEFAIPGAIRVLS
jgi:hypothetical protein